MIRIGLLIAFPIVLGLAFAPAAAEPQAVWCPNIQTGVFTGIDYGKSDAPGDAVRIEAVRNGASAGQVAVCFASPTPLGPVIVSDLKTADGKATIPASAVQVRYARPTNSELNAEALFPGQKVGARFDALLDAPMESSNVHVVWLTVHVAADAAAGRYAGTVAVAGRKVPVQVNVHNWRMPPAADFTALVDLIQSPETVALQYDVPMWSARHLELLARSLRLLGQVGNKTLYLPLICQTHFGNSQTMVYWVKTDSGYVYDFTPAEKYLDCALRAGLRPKVLVLYMWEPFTGMSHFGQGEGRAKAAAHVSLLDPASGKLDDLETPPFNSDEIVGFFKPVVDGLVKRAADRGIDDKSVMFGICGDSRPTPTTVGLFNKITPGRAWVQQAHGGIDNLYKIAPVGCRAVVWGAGSMANPDVPGRGGVTHYYGWRNAYYKGIFPRFGGTSFTINPPLWGNAPLATFHSVSEVCLNANLNGVSRLGADFWPVLKGDRGRAARLLNRYPISDWHQLTVSNAACDLLYPGPDGAVSTVRLEGLREGVQECEAKVFIERALLDPAAKAKLGPLADRCQKLLDDRIRALLAANDTPARPKTGQLDPEGKGWHYFATKSGWQDRNAVLFDAAGEVAKALGAPVAQADASPGRPATP